MTVTEGRGQEGQAMDGPDWRGVHHVSLNVHDVAASEQWYADVLGFSRVTTYATEQFERVILRHHSGVLVGLSRHRAAEADEPFDERRPGLDHLALEVADRDSLERWARRFDQLGVAHADIKPGAVPGSALLAFRDPDNIQLELISLPG